MIYALHVRGQPTRYRIRSDRVREEAVAAAVAFNPAPKALGEFASYLYAVDGINYEGATLRNPDGDVMVSLEAIR